MLSDYISSSLQPPFWEDFCCIYSYLSREDELHHLQRWATRKRLRNPRLMYEMLLRDTERLLFHLRFRSPKSYRWALLCHQIITFLFPAPTVHLKGSARRYKLASVLQYPNRG